MTSSKGHLEAFLLNERTTTRQLGDKVITHVFSPLSPPPQPPSSLPETIKPPLIYHITAPNGVTTAATLLSFLTTHTPLSTDVITSLTNLGAVYLHHSPSPRTSRRAVRQSQACLQEPLPLSTKIYCRIHAHPKRYTPLYAPLVIEELGECVVVHKPPGIPVCAAVDNCQECVTNLMKAGVTTRLDVGTSGVLVMGRGKRGVQTGNDVVKNGHKYYLVWVRGGEGDVPLGIWRDWYNSKARLGRGVVKERILRQWDKDHDCEGWVEAKLEVLSSRRFATKGGAGFVICLVQLLTGRTHQIRLQFCARGWCVLGDEKYSSVVGRLYDSVGEGALGGDASVLGLHCWKLCVSFGAKNGGRKVFTADIEKRVDLVSRLCDGMETKFSSWLSELEGGIG